VRRTVSSSPSCVDSFEQFLHQRRLLLGVESVRFVEHQDKWFVEFQQRLD